MKKSTFLTLLILVICIISMSMFFVACNTENTIIGSWGDSNGNIVFSFSKGGVIDIFYSKTSSDWIWSFDKKTNELSIKDKTYGVTAYKYKLQNNTLIRIGSYSEDYYNETYTKIS